MKKRVKVDVQMVREYLNVIILSLGILIPGATNEDIKQNHLT